MYPYKVLLATPTSETAMLMLGWLVRHGFYVGLSADVSGLSERAGSIAPPDCLLLDDTLGPATLPPIVRAARKAKGWERTAIIAFGNFNEEQETALFKAGVDDVVFKPLRADSLVLRMVRCVRVRYVYQKIAKAAPGNTVDQPDLGLVESSA